ncbi:NAD(P)/FAD-dependent oxidoreductase [Roseomonas marmotae]|uniref:FAD-dependent oxidoreductase n=1 Tax=Roseomonas marmotae TaxID=2768161 RepID=A0ABS3KAR3_9PROT|nr:FAD-dependent oxidoreductase [Roseomonas marmotae]MBO1074102.1 FAD-dependent oxidoreductase [Roseomonas marmotae]QTI78884.1 FAD-dependent oxidoreductase [Roseomonas marmotae]
MTASPHILVVGAGIVGLALAWKLQRGGATVTVLDPQPPGQGASFGNAGAISASSVVPLAMPGVLRDVPKMLLDPDAALHVPANYWLRAMPWFARFVASARPARVAEVARALGTLHHLAVEQHQALAREIGAPELVVCAGHLYLYRSREQLAKDTASWALRREHGARIETLDRDGIMALEPAVGPDYTVGQFLPDHAHCANPHRYCLALAEALTRNGARFVRDRALEITVAEGRASGIRGEAGHHAADSVAIAAGAWSARLLAPLGYRIPLESQRGYHVMLPRAGLQLGRCIVPADRKVFITPMEGGIRVGGTVEFGGTEKPPTPRRAELLYRDLKAVLPDASTEESEGFWMGHRPCLPDSLPVIGPSRKLPNLAFAFGHGHLGLTGAASTAELLAPAILGRPGNASLEAYAAERF